MSGQCRIEILHHVVDALKREDRELAKFCPGPYAGLTGVPTRPNDTPFQRRSAAPRSCLFGHVSHASSVLEYLSVLVLRLHHTSPCAQSGCASTHTPSSSISVPNHQNRACYFDAIQSVWDLVYKEIEENESKYPMTHSICYRLLQSNIFETEQYGNTVGTHDDDLSKTRLQLIRVVAHQLEQELYRENMGGRAQDATVGAQGHLETCSGYIHKRSSQTGGSTPFPVSIPEGVSERCAVLLNFHDLSTQNIYDEWCTLFTYIGVSDITDRECLQMCNRILLGPIFRSEQIRMRAGAFL
jgi:hypothetical protein